MPIHFKVNKEKHQIEANLSGVVTIAEMLETINKSIQHPDFEPGFNILSDHCDVEKVITLEQVESTINLLMAYSDRLKKSKWAIVTSKPASYGMMRLLSVHAEKIPLLVRVFKDHKTAGRWLASGMSKKSA